MTGLDLLRQAGTSTAAIEHHYDLPVEFFQLWLGPGLVYSCGLWNPGDPRDHLAAAQQRKLDFFAQHLAAGGARVLDVGCGWGAFADRAVRTHGARSAVGLTLSPTQARYASERATPRARFAVQSWVDHCPPEPYDVITAVESTEHLASDLLSADEKVEVYRAFFDRMASWLTAGGRLGLQLICLDGVGHRASRPGRGPLSELIRTEIFPESMPSSLSEMVLGWETHFELDHFVDHTDQYRRTFRAWATAYRAAYDRAQTLVGAGTARVFARYFAAGEVMFRTREQALYRVILHKREAPKRWAVTVRPSMLDAQPTDGRPVGAGEPSGASVKAVRSHYDLSNDFYGIVLGRTMMYSSALWAHADDLDLDGAQHRKIDWFGRAAGIRRGHRVLDVGCGWGGTLRRLREVFGVVGATGLTLSAAQRDFAADDPTPELDIRLESWADHRPSGTYDAIVSFGAFEHFARDGTRGPERIESYRRFFARCHSLLAADGRLGLETIAHDSAPDTAAPLGRGPLGDFVLGLFPESICPHLSEIVLGFEPWFEVRALRSDAQDFARTFRAWQLRLREQRDAATALVGAETVRRFARYLAGTEIQFRTGALTNYRLVLQRRPALKT